MTTLACQNSATKTQNKTIKSRTNRLHCSNKARSVSNCSKRISTFSLQKPSGYTMTETSRARLPFAKSKIVARFLSLSARFYLASLWFPTVVLAPTFVGKFSETRARLLSFKGQGRLLKVKVTMTDLSRSFACTNTGTSLLLLIQQFYPID